MATIDYKVEPEMVEMGKGSDQSPRQVCRLCLSEVSLEDIFSHDDLHTWISDLLSIVVSLSDTISQSICTDCRMRLSEFRNYQLRCLEVQDLLLSGDPIAIKDETYSPEGNRFVNHGELQITDVAEQNQAMLKIENPRTFLDDEYFPDGNSTTEDVNNPTNFEAYEESQMSEQDQQIESCEMCGKKHQHKHFVRHFKCERGCSSSFDCEDKRRDHHRRVHDAPQFKCFDCNLPFGSRQGIFKHNQRHHAVKTYKCIYCNEAFVTAHYLQKHMLVHDKTKAAKIFPCSQCGVPYATKKALKRHLTIHDSPYKGDDFRRSSLQTHTMQVEYESADVPLLADSREAEQADVYVMEAVERDYESDDSVIIP